MTTPGEARPVTFLADTHVHIYPCYDIGRALDHARSNLRRLAGAPGVGPGGCAYFLLLTERHDCHFFRDLANQSTALPEPYRCLETAGTNGLRIEHPEGPTLFLVAGRQVVTRERIEVLGLGLDRACPDGEPLAEVLPRLRGEGALPVLSWAPGKWFFARGKLVARQIDQADLVDALCLGDTTLRPVGWPLPILMRKGLEKRLPLLAGSDPLPFAGEEKQLGRYASRLQGTLDEADPARSCLDLLRDPAHTPGRAGRRDGPWPWLLRLRANHAARSAS